MASWLLAIGCWLLVVAVAVAVTVAVAVAVAAVVAAAVVVFVLVTVRAEAHLRWATTAHHLKPDHVTSLYLL